MAQFGFGLNINETAQETGYDQYKTSLFESLGAVAADNWNFNPVMSLFNIFGTDALGTDLFNVDGIVPAAKKSRAAGLIPRDKDLLNKEYKDLGLYFERNEYQSVVDIMVAKKKKERERQSIMSRGPAGSWNPLSGGFYVGAAKLAVGIGTSFLDPINIGASFIPIYGQARFARSIAKAKSMNVKSAKAFRNTRLKKGALEGAVGATLIEPLVYGVAQRIQADYDLYDSFFNVAFGTVIGGGLHVGAGKLKDMGTNANFQARILKNRENLSKPEGGDPEIDLYKEYYPEEVVDQMMKLDQMDAETRKILLQKGIGDMYLDEPVNIDSIVNADPTLNGTSTAELDLRLAGAKKNLETIKKDTQMIIREGGKVNKKHLQNAIKKYNDLLAERKKFEKPIDMEIIKAKKELDDAIKFSKSKVLTGIGGKERLVAEARKKYNDLLAKRKNQTEPVVNEPLVNTTKPSNELNITTKKQVKTFNDLEPSQQDFELTTKEARLIKLRTKQNASKFPLDFLDPITRKKDTLLEDAAEELDEINSKSDELKEAAADFINCTQGN